MELDWMRATARILYLAAGLLFAHGAQAQNWQQLQGEDLASAFKSHILEYDDGATQTFDPSGLTTYHKPAAWDEKGFWWVNADLLCLLYSPDEQANCFQVHQDGKGLQLRLEPKSGGSILLRYKD